MVGTFNDKEASVYSSSADLCKNGNMLPGSVAFVLL